MSVVYLRFILEHNSEELKIHLKEGWNYSLLPEPAWNLLVSWYGLSVGSRPIIRYFFVYS